MTAESTPTPEPENALPGVDFFRDEVEDLHEMVEHTRAMGTVVPVVYAGRRNWLINDYDTVKAAFSDEEHFSSESFYKFASQPMQGRTLQVMSGEEHRVNRALVSRTFFPKPVSEIVGPIIEAEADRCLDRIEGQTEVDLIEAYARPFPFTVIARMMGIPIHDEEKFLFWALMLIDFGYDPEAGRRAKAEFDEYMTALIHERRANPGGDLISSLATAEVEGTALTDEEILAFCRLLFPAGSDTTYKALGSLVYALLQHPQYIQPMLDDAGFCADVVQEGLRWEPPLSFQPRACSKDITLDGVDIKAGDAMMFGVSAANRDPKHWDDPHVFDPTRERGNLMTFGHGEHFCLGTHLARRELEVGIRAIFRRFPDMCLCADKPVKMIRAVLRGPKSLWVRPAG
ncbi:MAG: cytochrome P450 [Halioglobus sp.]|nr:cytochrome P450 [Halioglobus sp.]